MVSVEGGFKLCLDTYNGANGQGLTLEYHLHKETDPFEDPVIGVARRACHAGGREGEQFSRLHFYVNIDLGQKLEIDVHRVRKSN